MLNSTFPSSCLLFADDIVLFSDEPGKLQDLIDSLHQYCSSLNLLINTDKTKTLVFGQHPSQVPFQWSLNSNVLEVVEKFKYLGCTGDATSKITLRKRSIKQTNFFNNYQLN